MLIQSLEKSLLIDPLSANITIHRDLLTLIRLTTPNTSGVLEVFDKVRFISLKAQ